MRPTLHNQHICSSIARTLRLSCHNFATEQCPKILNKRSRIFASASSRSLRQLSSCCSENISFDLGQIRPKQLASMPAAIPPPSVILDLMNPLTKARLVIFVSRVLLLIIVISFAKYHLKPFLQHKRFSLITNRRVSSATSSQRLYRLSPKPHSSSYSSTSSPH